MSASSCRWSARAEERVRRTSGSGPSRSARSASASRARPSSPMDSRTATWCEPTERATCPGWPPSSGRAATGPFASPSTSTGTSSARRSRSSSTSCSGSAVPTRPCHPRSWRSTCSPRWTWNRSSPGSSSRCATACWSGSGPTRAHRRAAGAGVDPDASALRAGLGLRPGGLLLALLGQEPGLASLRVDLLGGGSLLRGRFHLARARLERPPEEPLHDEGGVGAGREREGDVHPQPVTVELVVGRLAHDELTGDDQERPQLVIEVDLRGAGDGQARERHVLAPQHRERRLLHHRVGEGRGGAEQRERLVAQEPRLSGIHSAWEEERPGLVLDGREPLDADHLAQVLLHALVPEPALVGEDLKGAPAGLR